MSRRVTKPLPSRDVCLEAEHNEIERGNDFVCLSAFSEVEGPCVVSVIPDAPQTFDSKRYALKIMSVDLHGQNATHLFVNDSQSVIQEGELHCYVHHSFFLDVRARGYTRPLSFSYITPDSEKIITYFDELLEEFTHISNILKFQNHLLFISELEEHLDLLESKLKADATSGESDKFYDAQSAGPGSDPFVTDDGESDYSSPEDQLPSIKIPIGESNSDSDLLDSRNKAVRRTSSLELVTESNTDSTEGISTAVINTNDTISNTTIIPNDSNIDSNVDNKEILNNEDIQDKDDNNEVNEIKTPKLGRSHLKQVKRSGRSISLPVTNVTNASDISPSTEDDDRNEQTMTSEQAINILRGHIRRVKQFYSRNSQPGPNPAIGELVSALSDSRDLKQELHMELIKKRASKKEELRNFDVICGNSFDFVLERIESICNHYSRDMVILKLEKQDTNMSVPLSTLLTVGNCPILNFNWDHQKSPKNFLNFPALPAAVNCNNTFGNEIASEYESFSEDESFFDATSSFPSFSSPSLHSQDLPSHNIIIQRMSNITSSTDPLTIYDPLFPMTLPTGCSFGSVELQNYASGLWNQSSDYCGKGLFQVYNKPYIHQLVYSLLIGRVVVIHASPVNERKLAELLVALTIFIPGCWRKNTVTLWQTTPLRITDLSSAKLIGLSKEGTPKVPEQIKKYITLMNFDDEILWAPPYESSFVEETLLPLRKFFIDESCLLAYIHGELFNLASKASLFYQMCCVAVTKPDQVEPGQKQTYSVTKNSEFLRKYSTSKSKLSNNNIPIDLSLLTDSLRDESKQIFEKIMPAISKNDIPIIEYLAEVIKEQQMMEMQELNCDRPILKLIEMPFFELSGRNRRKKN